MWKSTKFQNYLGTGSFGIVFQALEKDSQVKSAVKLIFPDHIMDDTENEKEQKRLLREYNLMKDKTHENVVKILDLQSTTITATILQDLIQDISLDETAQDRIEITFLSLRKRKEGMHTLCLKMELCGNTLSQWLKKNEDNLAPEIYQMQVNILQGLIAGLQFIHKHAIIHRDFRPANIMFSYNSEDEFCLPVKIGDFGLCRHVHSDESMTDTMTIDRGMKDYRAPEMNSNNYHLPADLFSFGLVMWEVLELIPNKERKSLFDRLVNDKEVDLVKDHPIILNGKELIIKLTKKRREDRTKSIDDVKLTERKVSFVVNSQEFIIQLANISNGGVIYLAAGIYEGDFVLVHSYVSVIGAGYNLTFIKPLARQALLVEGDNCTVSDVSFDLGSNPIGEGIDLTGSKNKVENVKFLSGHRGIFIEGDDNTFSSLIFENNRNGIELQGDSNELYNLEMKNLLDCNIQVDGHKNVLREISCMHINTIESGHSNNIGIQFLSGAGNELSAFNSIGISLGLDIQAKCASTKVSNICCGVTKISGASHSLVDCFLTVGDSESLKNCLLSCASTTIQLLEGLYDGEFNVENSNVLIQGSSREGTILTRSVPKQLEQYATMDIVGGGCKVSNMTFTSSLDDSTSIALRGCGNTLQNIKFVGGLNAVSVLNDTNVLTGLEVSNVDTALSIQSEGNKITNIRLDHVRQTGILIEGGDNDILAVECVDVALGVRLGGGDRNKVENVRWQKSSTGDEAGEEEDDAAILLYDGQFHQVSNVNCTATRWGENDWGLEINELCSNSKVANCNFQKVSVDGMGHDLHNVDASVLMEVRGSGHTFKECRGHVRDQIEEDAGISSFDCQFN